MGVKHWQYQLNDTKWVESFWSLSNMFYFCCCCRTSWLLYDFHIDSQSIWLFDVYYLLIKLIWNTQLVSSPRQSVYRNKWGQLFQVHSIIFVKVVEFSTPIRSHSNHQIQRWFQIQRPPYRNPLAISSFIFRLAYIFNC